MNRTTLALVIAAGILLIITVVQRIDLGPGAPRLSEWNGEADAIETRTGETTILLQQTQSGWVVGDEQYPANRQMVEQILDGLSGIGALEIVSEDTNYQRYELQEGSAIRVTASLDGEPLRRIYIGKSSSVGRQAYARTPDRNAVFLVSNSLRQAVNTNVADLREKTMLSAQQENVERVLLSNEDGAEVIVQREAGGSPTDNGENVDSAAGSDSVQSVEWQVTGADADVSDDAIDALFRGLARVDATSFEVSEPQAEPQASLTVELADGSALDLSIYEATEQGNFPATASTADFPFLLPSTTVNRLFLGLARFPGGE